MRNKCEANHVLLRNENYYFIKRVPCDLKSYYSVKRLCFSLKTKSYSSALRISKSVLQRLNANNETSLFKAFRNEHDYETMPYEFTDERLSEILTNIKKEHHPIAHKICSGEGIRLMNYDSMIVEHILDDFIKRDTAILSVHDSFVVQLGEENRLYELMKEAFERVMKVNKVKVKYNKNMTKQDLYSSRHLDYDYFIDMFFHLTKGSPTNGYKRRMERHNQYYNISNV
jgi:hypothetical protein